MWLLSLDGDLKLCERDSAHPPHPQTFLLQVGAVCHFKCDRLCQRLRLFLTRESQRHGRVKHSFHKELYQKSIHSSDFALISSPFNTVFAGHKFKGSCCLFYIQMDDYEQASVGSRTCFQNYCQISSVCISLLPLLSPLWWKKSHNCPLTLIS